MKNQNKNKNKNINKLALSQKQKEVVTAVILNYFYEIAKEGIERTGFNSTLLFAGAQKDATMLADQIEKALIINGNIERVRENIK